MRFGGTFFKNIQILRGIAALLVAASHLTASIVHADLPNPTSALDFGHFGVDLFFVISGFIMYYTSATDAGVESSWRFLVRRLIRVVPIYWIFTTIAFMQMLHSYGAEPVSAFQRWHTFFSYTFVPSLEIEGYDDVYPLYAVGWTLQYEMFFYVCFALSMLWKPQFRLGLLAVFLFSIVMIGKYTRLPLPLSFWTDPIVIEFVFGMVIARALRFVTSVRGWWAFIFAALALSMLLGETIHGLDAEADRTFWWGVPAAGLVSSAALAPHRGSNIVLRSLEGLGDMSYSLYLIHPLFYSIVIDYLINSLKAQKISYPALMISMLAGAIVASFLFYRWVERPMTRALQRRFLGRTSTIPAVLPAPNL